MSPVPQDRCILITLLRISDQYCLLIWADSVQVTYGYIRSSPIWISCRSMQKQPQRQDTTGDLFRYNSQLFITCLKKQAKPPKPHTPSPVGSTTLTWAKWVLPACDKLGVLGKSQAQHPEIEIQVAEVQPSNVHLFGLEKCKYSATCLSSCFRVLYFLHKDKNAALYQCKSISKANKMLETSLIMTLPSVLEISPNTSLHAHLLLHLKSSKDFVAITESQD